jgi:putative ABC transport system substrate-binding protein
MMVYQKTTRVGVLYTPTENNSIVTVDELRKVARVYKAEIIAIPFKIQDGLPVATNAVEALHKMRDMGVEWLYLPPDSFLGTQARDLVIPTAHDLGLLTFASTEQLMKAGAAFGLICPYFELGQLAAEKAKLILVNKHSPENIKIDTVERFTHVVNDAVVQKLGVTISPKIRPDITTIRIDPAEKPSSSPR